MYLATVLPESHVAVRECYLFTHLPIFLALKIICGEDKTNSLKHVVTLESCLWEHVCTRFMIAETWQKGANCTNKGEYQETTQPWPSAPPSMICISEQFQNSVHECSSYICFFFSFSSLFLFFFFFLHKHCRCRAELMPLAVLINCDSGLRNTSLHLNIEQATVRYSLYLVLMSLSKVSLPLQFPYLVFFFFTSCFPQLISLCQWMSLVIASQNYPCECILIWCAYQQGDIIHSCVVSDCVLAYY